MFPLMATVINDLRQMPCFSSKVFIAVIKHDDQKRPEEERFIYPSLPGNSLPTDGN